MEQSYFIARLLGPVLLIAAIPMMFNPKYLQELATEFLKSRALIYITGVLALLGGLGIVNSHNTWVANWQIIITLFGWAMVLGGAARVALPSTVTTIGGKMLEKPVLARLSGVVWALIGAFLAYQGYIINA